MKIQRVVKSDYRLKTGFGDKLAASFSGWLYEVETVFSARFDNFRTCEMDKNECEIYFNLKLF